MNRAFMGAFCVIFLVAGTRLAAAEDRDNVTVEVWVIRATTKDKDISPELRELAKKLQKDFKYTGFKLEHRAIGHTELDRGYTTELLDQYRGTVTPRRREGRNIRLQFEALRRGKSILNTTVTAPTGSFVPFGVGPLNNQDFLITAVRAR
jgi:hypothetical protein